MTHYYSPPLGDFNSVQLPLMEETTKICALRKNVLSFSNFLSSPTYRNILSQVRSL